MREHRFPVLPANPLLSGTVYSVPEALDKQVAKLKLEAMKVSIDRLTMEQDHYLASWSEGT